MPKSSEVRITEVSTETQGVKLSSMIEEGDDFALSDELEKKMALFTKKRQEYQKLFEVEIDEDGKSRTLSVVEIRRLQEALKLTGYLSATPNGVM